MAFHGNGFVASHEDGMLATFPVEMKAVLFQIADKVSTLYGHGYTSATMELTKAFP